MDNSDSLSRKLAAIMFTDMVGYTALMQRDETKARELIQRHRELMKPLIKKHGGEILQYVGDGTFCTFKSAIEAVNSAIEIQKVLEVEPEVNLRIGIHVGDVVVDGNEVYGDGVNIASRIEPLAKPGGICISSRVRDDIKNQIRFKLESLAAQDLKNVDEPMEVFVVKESKEDLSTAVLHKEKTSKRGLFYGALVIIGIVVGFFTYRNFTDESGTAGGISTERESKASIAVLPFTNMSSDPENEYFSDGITDDILTQLSKIRNLKVIARTSIMQYKNTNRRIRDIGEELHVSAILEGSVRRVGDKVRISGQLVDVKTEEHLWAETYDRDLDDIFAIQSDVAQKIAAALKATLTPEEKSSIEQKPTQNLDAYDYYLRGNALIDRSKVMNDKETLEEAIRMYEKAIEIDSEFVLSYTNLARAHLMNYWRGAGWDHSEERLVKAESALNKAIELSPDLPEVHLASGYYYYWGHRDYEQALEHFTIALDKEPNNSDLLAAVGFVKRRQGKWEEAVLKMKKASDLDPRSFEKHFETATSYAYMRNWIESERFLNRSLTIAPESLLSNLFKGFLYILSEGDVDKAREIWNESLEKTEPTSLVDIRISIAILEREYQKALSIAEADTGDWYIEKAWLYSMLKQPANAMGYYDSASVKWEEIVQKSPDDYLPHERLGIAYAGLGRKEEAIKEGNRAVELLPISKDALAGTDRIRTLAQVYSMVEEYDLAIDQLELLLSIPSPTTASLLELDPTWDSLRNHPRFRKLVTDNSSL